HLRQDPPPEDRFQHLRGDEGAGCREPYHQPGQTGLGRRQAERRAGRRPLYPAAHLPAGLRGDPPAERDPGPQGRGAKGGGVAGRKEICRVVEALKPLAKKAKKGFRGFPMATIAFYGPDDKTASKVVVGIFLGERQEAADLRRWFSDATDIRSDVAIL